MADEVASTDSDDLIQDSSRLDFLTESQRSSQSELIRKYEQEEKTQKSLVEVLVADEKQKEKKRQGRDVQEFAEPAVALEETADESAAVAREDEDDLIKAIARRSRTTETPTDSADEIPDSISTPEQQPRHGAFMGAPGSDLQRAAKVRYSRIGAPAMGLVDVDSSYLDSSHLSKAILLDDNNTGSKELQKQQQGGDIETPSRAFLKAGSGNSLPFARPVVGDDLSLPIAEEADPAEKNGSPARARTKNFATYSVVLVIVLLLGIALLLVFLVPWKDSEDETVGSQASSVPTAAPSMLTPELWVRRMLPIESINAMEKTNSPQAKAFRWIMEDPNLMGHSEERIIQRFSLSTIYYALGGSNWTNAENWLSYDSHECNWFAKNLTASVEAGDVALYLRKGNPFYQNLSSKSFPCDEDTGELCTHLWLYKNQLVGTIPKELYLLTSLKSIVMGENNLAGSTISTKIGFMTSLEYFNIMKADVEGSIPLEFSLLSNLQALHMARNRLDGTIPNQLAQLSDSLFNVDFFWNNLQGTIPSVLGSLTNIFSLVLTRNSLAGTFPSQLGRLTSLYELCLSSNDATGTIPSELGNLSKLGVAWLGRNHLTGTIPSQVGNLHAIEVLSLESGLLGGTIPSEIGGLLKLGALVIRDNNLSGSLPPELNSLAGNGSLTAFDVDGNNLVGHAPHDLCEIGVGINETCPFPQHVKCGFVFECSESFCGCDCPCSNTSAASLPHIEDLAMGNQSAMARSGGV